MPIAYEVPTEPLKAPHQKDVPYTDEQLQEVVDCAADPLYFLKSYMRVQHPIKGAIPFVPYPYQEEMINAFWKNRFCIALTARQMGKTTVAAGFLLWKAMFEPDTQILVVAHNEAGAIEILDRIRYAYETTPDFLRAGVVEYNKKKITFDNGSKIIARATSPSAARGLSITLLYVDEFAFLRDANLASEFWTSVRPTLATGGSCIITSTPKSDADEFSKIWRLANDKTDEYGNPTYKDVGKNEFYPIRVTWDNHPDRDQKWADKELADLGDARFRQEYCCEFVSDDLTLIDPIFLSQMRPEEPEYVVQFSVSEVRFYKDIEPNRTYLVGLDPSLGAGRDPAAIQVYELPGMVQVAEWSHNRTAMREQVALLKDILHYIDGEMRACMSQRGEPQIYWTIENNSLGMASVTIVSHTGEENFPGEFISEKRKRGQKRLIKGLVTSPAAKRAACVRFKSLLESGRMAIYSERLLRELKMYITNSNSAAAKPGETDDLISASLLCVRMLDYATSWSDDFIELQEAILDADEQFVPPAPMVF